MSALRHVYDYAARGRVRLRMQMRVFPGMCEFMHAVGGRPAEVTERGRTHARPPGPGQIAIVDAFPLTCVHGYTGDDTRPVFAVLAN